MNHNQSNEEPKKFRIPKTIEELKQWYKDMNLPHETVTRFFIGKNVTYKRAFGIYQDPETNNFVVYKNKDTGERKIRYEGPNEAHAVKELYDRLVAEIKNQKAHNVQNSKIRNSKKFDSKKDNLQKEKWYSGKPSNPSSDDMSLLLVILAFICFFFIIMPTGNTKSHIFSNTPDTGYYYYDDSIYYFLHGIWYINDGNNNWSEYDGDKSELNKNYKNYEDNNDSSNADKHTFEDSEYYSNDDYSYDSGSSSNYSSGWDSGSSWSSSDSWSSGSTNFSSDW